MGSQRNDARQAGPPGGDRGVAKAPLRPIESPAGPGYCGGTTVTCRPRKPRRKGRRESPFAARKLLAGREGALQVGRRDSHGRIIALKTPFGIVRLLRPGEVGRAPPRDGDLGHRTTSQFLES
jgi:hypothetical protein